MSRSMQSSHSQSQLNYHPALSVLLRQQDAHTGVMVKSNSRASLGHGRNAKSAKGLLKSMSEAQLRKSNHKLATLQQQQQQQQVDSHSRGSNGFQPFGGQQKTPLTNPVEAFPHQQQTSTHSQSDSNPTFDIWRAEQSKPTSKSGARASSSSSSLSSFVPPAHEGESLESRAFRSLPQHSFATSQYYRPAPSDAVRARHLLHTHQYPDGSIVDECTCERGTKLVEAERNTNTNGRYPPSTPSRVTEEKDGSTQQQQPASPVKGLTLEQVERARAAALVKKNASLKLGANTSQDTSRRRSVYASMYKPLEVPRQTDKLGKPIGMASFASHNKSYIRSCLQDPGYGFNIDTLKAQDPTHYAAEITREHEDPSKRLRSVIAPVNWPDTTHHADFAPPSAELIKSYKRVGKDYRQSMNKSYIRMNLIDPDLAAKLPSGQVPSTASVRVPFTADTTHHSAYQDFRHQIPSLRGQSKASVQFGMESGPTENIWAPWDDSSAAYYVRNIANNDVVLLQVSPYTKIGSLKHVLQDRTGVPVLVQRLNYEGRLLHDEKTLIQMGVQPDSTIELAEA